MHPSRPPRNHKPTSFTRSQPLAATALGTTIGFVLGLFTYLILRPSSPEAAPASPPSPKIALTKPVLITQVPARPQAKEPMQSTPRTLIAPGSFWKYSDGGAQPEWPASDATRWKTGPSPLGFGAQKSGVLATTVAEGRPCYYFRREFTSADDGAGLDLMLKIKYDDGAIVYLNGVEVKRLQLPSGPCFFDTWAYLHNPDDWESFHLDAARIRQGLNVLAVEVHNRNAASHDIYFDLQLEAVARN
jgi:hypothetical protein